ncbi:hypothetical protein BS17DRAFT_718624, partial [Gyrodon lividus]
PLVQILVVVANIQVRSLKTEVEKGSVVTAVGHGARFFVPLSKGNPVNVPEPECGISNGNINELGDAGEGPGKSYLFSLTASNPEIDLLGARV